MNHKLTFAIITGLAFGALTSASAAIISPTNSTPTSTSTAVPSNTAPQPIHSANMINGTNTPAGTNATSGTASGMMNAPTTGSAQTINQPGVTTRTDLTTGRIGAPSSTTNATSNSATSQTPSATPTTGVSTTGTARSPANPNGNARPQVGTTGMAVAIPQSASQQGTSAYDAAVTRQIRERITRSDLSMNARNVKIITLNGEVVLRGPVDSSTEQTTIQSIASDIVGSGRVRNETTIR